MKFINSETEAFANYIQTKRDTDPEFDNEVATLAKSIDPKPLIERFQQVAREELDWQGPYTKDVNLAEVADSLVQARLSTWTDRIKAGMATARENAR